MNDTGASVSVLIPTFRRPIGLARAVASALVQTRLPDEIIIVDNDPDASARELASELAEGARIPVRYVHEPRPGVANARNLGFATASGRYIAQLDDDEAARPEWLAALLATRAAMDCPVVFGPVTPLATNAAPMARAFLERLYARTGPNSDAARTRDWGCGNSLIDREAVPLPDPPFDARTNEVGGEDDLLFVGLQNAGIRFAWSADAEVIEYVEGDRARWPHMLARSFAYGQGASQKLRSRWPGKCAGPHGMDGGRTGPVSAVWPYRSPGPPCSWPCARRSLHRQGGARAWQDILGRQAGAALLRSGLTRLSELGCRRGKHHPHERILLGQIAL